MTTAAAPIGDYQSLVDLTGRIHAHLRQHPGDAQALDDLHYVVSLLKGRQGATQAANTQDAATGAPESNPGLKIGAGLMQAGLDIPKGAISAILHPIQTLGQATGIANIPAALKVGQDPEASIGDKLDAILRASPANLGYAPERALLEATGAKSDAPASLQEQAHRAGNVASLGLLGVKPSAVLNVVRGGARSLIRPVLKGILGEPTARAVPTDPIPTDPSSYGAANPSADFAEGMGRMTQAQPEPVPTPPPGIMPPTAAASLLGTPEEIAVAKKLGLPIAAVRGRVGQPRAPVLTPMPGAPQGLLGPEGLSPPPRASYPPTLAEMQGFNTAPRPMPDLGTGKLLPYYPRGGLVEQALGQPPPVSSVTAPSPIALAQFKMLMQMPDAELAQVEGMFPREIIAQIRALRAQSGLLTHQGTP